MKNNGCGENDELDTVLSHILVDGKLIISSNDQCTKIKQKWWKSIEVGDNLCNSLTTLSLVDYVNLESLQVGSNSFTAVTSFTISNAKNLISISVSAESFKAVTSLKLSSMA